MREQHVGAIGRGSAKDRVLCDALSDKQFKQCPARSSTGAPAAPTATAPA